MLYLHALYKKSWPSMLDFIKYTERNLIPKLLDCIAHAK